MLRSSLSGSIFSGIIYNRFFGTKFLRAFFPLLLDDFLVIFIVP